MPDGHTSDHPTEEEIRAELNRVLESAVFLQSDRLGRFLRFAIENALSGKKDLLKEYVIGTEVYDRKPPYHPSQDSIVRTEARRLRAKLKEYYESEGKGNPVFIYFRPGTYVPLFRRNEEWNGSSPNGASTDGELLTKGVGVAVAVLPLLDLSSQPLSALCAQGVTDEIVHKLTHTDGIRVIARTSQMTAGEMALDIPALSQKHGINIFVDGTVRQEFNRLLITVRVLGSDGFQLSSHRFETVANAEILARVQEQVATAFISRARPEMSQVRRRKAAPGALMLASYALVMHGEALLDEGSSTDLQAALLKFEEAAEVAPNFARPYCGISHCFLDMVLRGAMPSSSLVSRAKLAAQRAAQLDPEMIESYSCLGGAQALEWDWAEAERSFLRGMGLGTHVSAARRYGLFLAAMGRFDEAAHHIEKAQRIDPFSNRQKVAWMKFLHLTRRFDEGLRQLSEPLIYGPLPLEAQFLLALMAAHSGDKDRAKRLIEGLRSSAGGQPALMAGTAEVLALSGESREARRIAEDFKLLSSDSALTLFRQALLALALGEIERALSLLALAAESREAELVWIKIDPRFDEIRDVAGFRDLVRVVFAK